MPTRRGRTICASSAASSSNRGPAAEVERARAEKEQERAAKEQERAAKEQARAARSRSGRRRSRRGRRGAGAGGQGGSLGRDRAAEALAEGRPRRLIPCSASGRSEWRLWALTIRSLPTHLAVPLPEPLGPLCVAHRRAHRREGAIARRDATLVIEPETACWQTAGRAAGMLNYSSMAVLTSHSGRAACSASAPWRVTWVLHRMTS